jgi:hypothetical protein
MKRILLIIIGIEVIFYLTKAFIVLDWFWPAGMLTPAWSSYDRIWFVYFMIFIPVFWALTDYWFKSKDK